MEALLNETEVRVVGALVEKAVTTPEYYPLTLNALVNACNQTSNRDPVVSFDDKQVARALESLRDKNLVHIVHGSDARVPKYRHFVHEVFRLNKAELSLICVLMLRGWQTVGELRGRTARLYEFTELANVEATLEGLMTREPQPLVTKLPRQHGQKDARFAHLLAGEIAVAEVTPMLKSEPAMREVLAENERLRKVEAEVESLRSEVAELRQQFAEFKQQFD